MMVTVEVMGGLTRRSSRGSVVRGFYVCIRCRKIAQQRNEVAPQAGLMVCASNAC